MTSPDNELRVIEEFAWITEIATWTCFNRTGEIQVLRNTRVNAIYCWRDKEPFKEVKVGNS